MKVHFIQSGFTILLLVILQCSRAQTISSFSPTSGPPGTTVVITGTGFDATPANNIVFFGATIATVSAATITDLTVTVPDGTNYQYITVTNLTTNKTAYSEKPFVVTTLCADATTYTTAASAQGGSHNVEICDIDGDGLADLIIPDYFNNYFTVTRNTSTPGTISFAAKVTFAWASGGQPNEVSLGDFDGDGKPDVALGGNGGGTFVSVYRNTSTPGSISFAARQDFTASSGQGNGNKVIDVDGDGRPDLLSVHWSGNCLWVLRNTSTGPGVISFAAGVSFTTTSQPHKIDVGDLDGDKLPDVVITAFTSNKMSIFRNTSTPGTISFATRQDFSPGTVPYFVHIGDLDGDGLADISIVNRDVATLAVYRNTSSLGSISLATRQDFATPAGTMTHYGLAIGDLNGDAKPDIVVGNYTLNKTSIFQNTSTVGSISFATRVDITTGVSYDCGIDDFDGDGRPDIAVTNSGTTVSILQNACLLLPVGLTSFEGWQQDQSIRLAWTTESEFENHYFTLERSNNGMHFTTLGFIDGAGTSNESHNYSFSDDQPYCGMNYYRLLQTDLNGMLLELETIPVMFLKSMDHCYVAPNPFTSYCMLYGTSAEGLISIYDLKGCLIWHQYASDRTTEIPIQNLHPGMYLLRYLEGENSIDHMIQKL